MIKAIIFDCFGVLTNDNWQAFLESLPDDADIDAARHAHRAYSQGLINKEECAKQISAATGRIFTEVEDVVEEKIIKNTKLVNYIQELHKLGYKIGILSNVASNWIREHLLTEKEQNLIDVFVFSYEIGLIKPDLRIYRLAASKLGILPEETVIIDDKQRYCVAAEQVGMQAILYKDFKQMKTELEKILADTKG